MTKNIIQIIIIISLCLANFVVAQAIPSKKASLVMDLDSGKVLHAENEHALRYPASLVKMMTLYLAFKKLDRGELSLDTNIRVSSKAASMPRLNLALKADSKISVRKAILGIIVHSSNDTAVALAEAIGGSEALFVVMMNNQAKKLGMSNTVFRNASGMPNKEQKSTAHDLATLAIALKKDFPQYFPWFSMTSFTINGRTYNSHNRVLLNYQWANGLKTGFTNASGFNLATTAHQSGRHLVAVVMGENTSKARDKLMIHLLDSCFNRTRPRTEMAQLSNKLMPKAKKTSINKRKRYKKIK